MLDESKNAILISIQKEVPFVIIKQNFIPCQELCIAEINSSTQSFYHFLLGEKNDNTNIFLNTNVAIENLGENNCHITMDYFGEDDKNLLYREYPLNAEEINPNFQDNRLVVFARTKICAMLVYYDVSISNYVCAMIHADPRKGLYFQQMYEFIMQARFQALGLVMMQKHESKE